MRIWKRPVSTGNFCSATQCNFCRALSSNFKIARVSHLLFCRRDISEVSNVMMTQSVTKIASNRVTKNRLCKGGLKKRNLSNAVITNRRKFVVWKLSMREVGRALKRTLVKSPWNHPNSVCCGHQNHHDYSSLLYRRGIKVVNSLHFPVWLTNIIIGTF